MRSLPFLVVCLLTACSPEDLSGFQPPARVNEIAHTVTTTFEDGTARLRVRRTLQNGSGEYEAVGHKFKLPEGAVATSLRIGSNGQWLAPGTLASSDDVETKWDLLRSLGTAAPSTIGKLAWEWDGSLQFELFGLAPNATVDIEYDVELPSSYAAGAVSFVYPLEEVELGWLPPSFPGLQSQQLESGLELRRAWTTRSSDADVRWATFPIDTNRNLWRLEVDVAAQLGELPKNANVVFVVDASISEGEKGVASQLELITPYLASVPDARVEVVVFRRYAERLFGRFVPASEFARELTMLAPERLAVGNGSNLDVGAQLAFDLLTHEGRLDLGRAGGNGRVVTFTDEQLKDALTVDALVGAMKQAPRDAVVHIVRRDESYGDSLSERRDDASRFARAAAVTGGIFLRVDGHPSDAVLDADVMRGLVRPIRIDDFAVVANDVATPPQTPDDTSVMRPIDEAWDGVDADDESVVAFSGFRVDSIQNEGASVRLAELDALPPQSVTVRGKIWARSFERVVTIDDALARRLPAYAVGDESLRGQLSDDELRTVSFVSGAVSPVTSYLAAPQNAAPSVIGLELMPERGGLGMRGIGCGGCGTSSRCGLRVGRVRINLLETLRVLLEPGVAACESQFGARGGAKLSLEATADEVVDAQATGGSDAMNACLVEAAWAVRLTDVFEHHRTYDIEL